MDAKILCSTANMSYDEWQTHRAANPSIGGSLASSIMGLNPYSTAVDAYLELIGESEPIEDNSPMYWGRKLEPVIADAWREQKEQAGKTVRRKNAILYKADKPFMTANLDRLVIEPDKEQRVLEIKTASSYMKNHWGKAGSSEIPDQYQIQIQHYLNITGLEKAYCVVLLAGNELRTFNIERHEPLIDELNKKLTIFWEDHVLPKKPPLPVTGADVQKLMPIDNGSFRTVGADEYNLVHERYLLNKKKKELDKQIKFMDNQIKLTVKENTGIVDHDGKKMCSFKSQSRTSLDTKAIQAAHPKIYENFSRKTSYRVLKFMGDFR